VQSCDNLKITELVQILHMCYLLPNHPLKHIPHYKNSIRMICAIITRLNMDNGYTVA
jgi:hypothetical protein